MRPFRPDDLPAMYRICLLTGDAGGDATARYQDPDLVGHVFAGPYPAQDPALTFVVEDDEGVAGYLVGTADTEAFRAWTEEHWWPALRERYPVLPDDGVGDRWLVEWIHHPPTEPPPAGHPAHLHIDLLPRLQRQGWGRRLIDAFRRALADRGVQGVGVGFSLRAHPAGDRVAAPGVPADHRGLDDPAHHCLCEAHAPAPPRSARPARPGRHLMYRRYT